MFNRDDNQASGKLRWDANHASTMWPAFSGVPSCWWLRWWLRLLTMTRMVEEQRMEIGTLKAPGPSCQTSRIKFVIAETGGCGGAAPSVWSANVIRCPGLIVSAYIVPAGYQVPELSRFQCPGALSASLYYYPSCALWGPRFSSALWSWEEPLRADAAKGAGNLGKAHIFLEKFRLSGKRMGFISQGNHPEHPASTRPALLAHDCYGISGCLP